MGQIMLPPGVTSADYRNWLASPAGQQAQSAENDRVRQRGGPWVSSDGMVQMPQNWRQDMSSPAANAQPQGNPYGMPQGNQFGGPVGGTNLPAALWGPGQAQPSQPQSQGTPYGGDMAAWGSQAAAQSATGGPVQNIGNNTWVSAPPPRGGSFRRSTPYPTAPPPSGGSFQRSTPYPTAPPRYDIRSSDMPTAPPQGDPPRRVTPRPTNSRSTQVSQEAPSFTPGGGPGNMAYAPPDQRPPPFQQRMTDWTGRPIDPSQGFAQRGAFVQNINQSRAQHAAGWGQGNYRAPPKNFGAMWGQAGDMAQQGWQNPLSGLFGQQPQGRRRSGFARDPNGPPLPPGAWV